MNKMKKALLTVVCASCLVVVTIFGTLAYLTDKDSNVNTFTVGKVDILLDELDVDNDEDTSDITTGTSGNGQRDKANEYHLIPGQTYTKDPTVTVKADSESSYIYMIVTVENINQLKDALPMSIVNKDNEPIYYKDNVFLLQNLCDWQANSPWQYKGYREYTETVEGNAITKGEYRFVYKNAVAGETTDKSLEPLFNTITVPGKDITSDNIGNLSSVKIIVNAYAVQEAGFTENLDYNDAWAAASFSGYTDDIAYDIAPKQV